MYKVTDNYMPFLPCLIKLLRQKHDDEVLLKSGHAHEIASAYFGFKSYASAKTAKLNQQIGIFPQADKNLTTHVQFFIKPELTIAKIRINKLLPELTNCQTEKILSRLDDFYIYESGTYSGFVARLTRQLSIQYNRDQKDFSGSALMTYGDWRIANEIVFGDDYIPQTFCSYPLSDFEVIGKAEPLLVGDHLYQCNIDTMANIINFVDPTRFDSLIKS